MLLFDFAQDELIRSAVGSILLINQFDFILQERLTVFNTRTKNSALPNPERSRRMIVGWKVPSRGVAKTMLERSDDSL